MARAAPTISSSQPDFRVLHILSVLQRICLSLVAFLSAVTLWGWMIPAFGRLLPVAWDHMKANTALMALLCALGLFLSRTKASARSILISRILLLSVIFISGVTIVERLLYTSTWIDTLITSNARSLHNDRPTPQIAYSFLLIAILALFMRARKTILAQFIDAITVVLSLMMLVFVAGYLFATLQIFGVGMYEHFSPQTLLSLALLTFVAFNRRTEHGIFSILLGDGLGGKTARLASPLALLLPLVLTTARGSMIRFGVLQNQYATALNAAFTSFFAFCLILALSRRIDSLEKDIRDLSLRDELTQLYNRRGFMVLTEQALRLCRRAREPFSVLFIDMDNLKAINDVNGHEAGSVLLQEMAVMLKANFRTTDVLGRLGGDEFVVAGKGSSDEIIHATKRLLEAANVANIKRGDQCQIEFSFGYVTSTSSTETLDEMLHRADKIMYESKRLKKSFRSRPRIVQPTA
jgi:diguanylate cyclase (GGDEF)-like protein